MDVLGHLGFEYQIEDKISCATLRSAAASA